MIQAVLLDLDGTVYQSGRAIPGAVETVERLREAEFPLRFVTNTTNKPRSVVLERLQALGFEASVSEIVTAPVAAASWLCERGISRISPFLVNATLEDFEGFEIVETEPKAVLVGDLGEAWNFVKLNEAFQLLNEGARLVALQKNRYWRKGEDLTLDAGPFVAALEYAAGVEAVVVGKPEPAFFCSALSALGVEPENAIMVGDDLDSDVVGARNAGLIGVAVRTGKWQDEDENRAKELADDVLDSVADLPAWLGVE